MKLGVLSIDPDEVEAEAVEWVESPTNGAEQDGIDFMDDDNIEIEIVKAPIKIAVNLDLLTADDVFDLQEYSEQGRAGAISEKQAREILHSIVSKATGQDSHKMGARIFNKVLEAIFGTIKTRRNAGNSASV